MELVGLFGYAETALVVAWLHVALVGLDPDLQRMRLFRLRGVVLGVEDAGAGRHVLQFTGSDRARAAGGVFVREGPGDHVGEDLHVVVGMHAEAAAGSNDVVVDDAESAEAHPFGVVVVGKAEGEVCIEPTVVGVAAFCSRAHRDHGGCYLLDTSTQYPDGLDEGPSAGIHADWG